MTKLRRLGPLVAAVVSVTIGCASGVRTAGSPGTHAPDALTPPLPFDDNSTADLLAHDSHLHRGGFAMFVEMSLNSFSLTPGQDAGLVALRSELRGLFQPSRDAERAVLLALADGVAAGHVDADALAPSVAALGQAADRAHVALLESLDRIHAILTPQQRRALAERVEAYYSTWFEIGAKDDARATDARAGRLARLASGLALSDDQVTKIRDSLAATRTQEVPFARADAEAYVRSFGAAFARDTFAASDLPRTPMASAHMARFGVTRMIRLYTAVAPVLTAAQRDRLATAMRRHADDGRAAAPP